MPFKDPEQKAEYQKRYYEAHKEKLLQYAREHNKEYHELHKEDISKRKKRENKVRNAKPENRIERNKKKRLKWKTDPEFALREKLRHRLWDALRCRKKVGSAVKDLGCTIKELKEHLEQQFQPEMSWDNWSYRGWHIDHKKPFAVFDLTQRDQLLEACHFTNLRPMWGIDNMKKHSKLEL